MKKYYTDLNETSYFFLRARFVILDLLDVIQECISFKILHWDLESIYSDSVGGHVNNVVEFVGEYVSLEEFQKDYVSYISTNYSNLTQLKSYYSYSMFYSTLRHKKEYAHLEDINTIFNLECKLISNGFTSNISNTIYKFNNLEHVTLKQDLYATAYIIGEVNVALKDTESSFTGCSFPALTRVAKNNHIYGLWTTFKRPRYYVSSINYKFFLPIFRYVSIGEIPLKNKTDIILIESPEKMDLKGNVFPFSKFININKTLLPVSSVLSNMNVAVLYNLNSIWSLSLHYNNYVNLDTFISQTIHVIPVVSTNDRYQIMDLNSYSASIFNVEKVKDGTISNLKGVTLYLCDMAGIYQLEGVANECINFKIITFIEKNVELNDIVSLYAELELVTMKRFMDLKNVEKDDFLRMRIYSLEKYNKNGLNRTFTFVKTKKKPNKAVPFYKQDWIKDIKESKMTNISSDLIVYSSGSHVEDSSYVNTITNDDVLVKTSNSMFYGNMDIIKNGIGFNVKKTIDDSFYEEISVFMYSNNGIIDGYVSRHLFKDSILISDSDKTLDIPFVIKTLRVYLNTSYKKAVYILKTKADGTYLWDEETISRAVDILTSNDVIQANLLCGSLNINPYGIEHIVRMDLNSSFYNKVYYFRNKDNYAIVNGIECYFDVYPISNIKIEYQYISNFEYIKNIGEVKGYYSINNPLIKINPYSVNIGINKKTIILNKDNKYFYSFKGSEHSYIFIANSTATTEDIKRFNLRRTNTNDAIFNFVLVEKEYSLNSYYFELKIGLDTKDLNSLICDMCDAKISMNLALDSLYSPFQKLHINMPTLLNTFSSQFIISYKTINVLNDYNSVHSVEFKIRIAKRISLEGIESKYDSFWMQIYFSNYSDIAIDETIIYNFNRIDSNFKIDMPVVYMFKELEEVEDSVVRGGKSSIGYFKSDGPLFGTYIIDPYPVYIGKSSHKNCTNVYNRLSANGFNFEIERDDKLLIGNNVYNNVKMMYGSGITEVQSIFAEGRTISDNGIFSENVQEAIVKAVDLDKINNFREEDLVFTEDDFGGKDLPANYLNSINKQLSDGVSSVNTNLKQEDVTVTPSKPLNKQDQEILDRYIDDLGSIFDSVQYDKVPTKPIIDGKLLKKVVIEQGITLENVGEEDV